jgi:hypothetical protein
LILKDNTPRGVIPLFKHELESVDQLGKLEGFFFLLKRDNRYYVFQAITQSERDKWVEMLTPYTKKPSVITSTPVEVN